MRINLKFIVLGFIFLLACCRLDAQTVQTPCARILAGLNQDSITWTATPCAGFSGYVILSSPDLVSPLVPIDTITSAAQFGYLNANPGEAAHRYQIAMICNGTLTGQSTIVSNQRPVTPNLRSVNIVNNQPVLSWYASPSPEVIGYQVYKENPYGSGNFFPYPNNNSTISGLSFTDTGGGSLLVRYAIVAVSPCNEGLLGEGGPLDGTTGPHTSMIVDASIDSCTRQVTLSWNAYENWQDDVDFYIVHLSTNGGTAQAVDTVSGTNFIYTGAQDGDLLTFWIEAKEKNQNNNAISNRVSINASVNRPIDYLQLLGVTIDATTQQPEITWRWDMDSDFASAVIERRTDSTAWTPILTINSLVSETRSFSDAGLNTSQQRYFYRIVATDACSNTVTSNVGATLLLSGEAQDAFINHLFWAPLFFEFAAVDHYEMYKVVDVSQSMLTNLNPSDSLYDDHVNVRNQAESNSCYYILAEGFITFPGGSPRLFSFRSNTICLRQNAVLWFPNAFVPHGTNDEFRPLVGFGRTLQSYNLQIYDRFGALVFETNDIFDGWDGNKAGKEMPQGVYVYVARFTQADGTIDTQKGTLMLLR